MDSRSGPFASTTGCSFSSPIFSEEVDHQIENLPLSPLNKVIDNISKNMGSPFISSTQVQEIEPNRLMDKISIYHKNLSSVCLLQQQQIVNQELEIQRLKKTCEILEIQNDSIKAFLLKYINQLLESIVKELVNEISKSPELQKRIGLDFGKHHEMNAEAFMTKIVEHLNKEKEPEDFKEFLRSDDLLKNFVWCTPDSDDLLILVKDLTLTLSVFLEEGEELKWAAALNQQSGEIHEMNDKVNADTGYLYAGIGIASTGVSITFKTLYYLLKGLKTVSQFATLAGVTAIVLQSPWLPILRIVLNFVLTKL